MKFSRLIFALFLVCCVSIFVFAQDKDKKQAQKPVEVKANVAVLDSSGNLAADTKLEDLKIFEDGVEQKITYFAKKEPILNLGLVFDNTGSMRMQLDKATWAGAVIASNLLPTDEAFIVRFVDSDVIEIVQPWTSNKSQMKTALQQMFVEGGQSAITDALYLSAAELSIRQKKEPARRYALVLITDGEDRDSYYKLDEMLSLIEKTDVQIFVIALTKDLPKKAKTKAERYVRRVALETGGNAYVLSDKYTDNVLLGVTKSILGELRSQYVVGYTSTDPNRDDQPRKLTVQVSDNAKGEKRTGLIRENFVVPKD